MFDHAVVIPTALFDSEITFNITEINSKTVQEDLHLQKALQDQDMIFICTSVDPQESFLEFSNLTERVAMNQVTAPLIGLIGFQAERTEFSKTFFESMCTLAHHFCAPYYIISSFQQTGIQFFLADVTKVFSF